jgi:formylglycine-generating enzyme required for sulfatase activity
MFRFLTPIVVALAGLLLIVTQSAAATSTYDESLLEIAKSFSTEAKKRRLHRLTVSTFTSLEGQPTAIGRFLADELTSVLARESMIEVIDQQQIVQLFKGQEMASPGSPSLSDLTKLSQVAGIDAVITGSVVEFSDTIHLSAKLIGTRAGTVVTTAKTAVPKVAALAELSQVPLTEGTPTIKRKDVSPPESPDGMVLIPAGNFIYGDGKMGQDLTLPAFWMDMFEVTKEEFAKILGYKYDLAQANHPMTNVTWKEAQLFCEILGKRLPTEQEWEKSARGTDGRLYPWGNVFESDRANAQNRVKESTPVGQFPDGRSPYGLQDMAGNVMEWTSSEEQKAKVFRGGSWGSPPEEVQVTFRNWIGPAHDLFDLGFRCAKDVPR